MIAVSLFQVLGFALKRCVTFSTSAKKNVRGSLEHQILDHIFHKNHFLGKSLCAAERLKNLYQTPRCHTESGGDQAAASVSEEALQIAAEPGTPLAERGALLALAARLTPPQLRPSLRSAVLAALEPAAAAAEPDTPCLLSLLLAAALSRAPLPRQTWRQLQRSLATQTVQLSPMDLVMLCSSSFRCSAPVTEPLLRAAIVREACRLADDAGTAGSDPAHLVALVKALRLARVAPPALLAALRRYLLRRDRALTLPCAAHLGAAFASPPRHDLEVLQALETTLFLRVGTHSQPSASSPVPDGRPKDAARLLHVLSQLGQPLRPETVRRLLPAMSAWKSDALLVDALLSLAVLGLYPLPLLERVLTRSTAAGLEDAGRTRQLSRLAVLRLAASLETRLQPPPLASLLSRPASLPAPSVHAELARRPALARLLCAARCRWPDARVQLARPVPHINIASVVVSEADGQRHCLELLDGNLAVSRLDGGSGRPTENGPQAEADESALWCDECGDGQLGEVVTVQQDVAVGEAERRAAGLARLKLRLARRLGYTVACSLPSDVA